MPAPHLSEMTTHARISECGKYRYSLGRHWDGANADQAVFLMLNPSKADAERNDPTITRCVRFAYEWGCGGLWVVNLYALRATDPVDLWKCDPKLRVGPDNDDAIRAATKASGPFVLAYGAHDKATGRSGRVRAMLAEAGVKPMILAETKKGHPQHPLFVRADTKPFAWGY